MNEWILPVTVALIGAASGIYGAIVAHRTAKDRRQAAEVKQKSVDARTAVEGFAELVNALRTQIDRERDECKQEITELQERCRRRYQALQEQLQAVEQIVGKE